VKCGDCDKSFSSKSSLKNHIKSLHQIISDYKCCQCCQFFSNQSDLKDHIKFAHYKPFRYKSHANNHTKNIDDYKCDACDNYLDKHIKTDHRDMSDVQKRKTENVEVISIKPSVKSSPELKKRPSILSQNLIQIPSFRKCFQCSKLFKLSEYKLHILQFHKN